MFKKILVLLFILFTLVQTSQAYAFDPFISSPNNPLPFSDSFQNWNETRMYQPSVLFEEDIYKMWYASYTGSAFKIIYSTSTDGINWSRQNLLDVYPGFDNHDPSILKTQNGYSLFFTGSTSGGSQNFKIYKIDSADGVNFNQNSRELLLQPSGSLESNAVTSPFVLTENGSYYMFYECWGAQGFRICMATSSDGSLWQRCSNNPVINELSDGPSLLKKDGRHYLFFQSNLGVRQAESVNALDCSMSWTNFQTVLPESIVGPVILEKQNQLMLYYSGFSPAGMKIHLATSGTQILPTPTLTPLPTITPSITPTPTQARKKIVLIPGIFSSWNRDAMLHNIPVPNSQWKLLSFVKEYDGLIQTLENLNYEKDVDFFVYTYDWRKKLDDLADDLRQFIYSKNLATTEINLVGHSLGGVVGRIYSQRYGVSFVDHLVTIGSPHKGTANSYKIVEAGELENNNSSEWLMQKLLLQINRKNFSSDRQIIQSLIPITKDLFPIYDFLKDSNNHTIPVENMQVKNINLLSYSSQLPAIYSKLSTISGEKGNNTLNGFKIVPRSGLDILLDNYPDGRPIQKLQALGDNLVTKDSSSAGNDLLTLPGNHGEIIYEPESIHNILSKLNIPHGLNQIQEGRGTVISPSLIFALFSPAVMQVDYNGQHFYEDEGLVFVENAQAGNYNLKVKGKYPGGKYTILVGQIGNNSDNWFEIHGEINKFLPAFQTDAYDIDFDPQNLKNFPVNQKNLHSLLKLVLQRMLRFQQECGTANFNRIFNLTKGLIDNLINQRIKFSSKSVLEVHKNIFQVKAKKSLYCRHHLYGTLTQIENIYERISLYTGYKPNSQALLKKLNHLKSQYTLFEKYLLSQKNKKFDIQEKAVSLSQMKEKLQNAEEELSKNNLPLSEIILYSAELLSKEIK